MVTPNITEMVRNATVVIATDADASKPVASGFFVAPNRVLTCAHVVLGRNPLWVQWNGGTQRAEVLACVPDTAPAGGVVPAPDAAILSIAGFAEPHPVVPLGDAEPALDEKLYLFGMTRVRIGVPERDGVVVRYNGRVGDHDELYKLAGGLIASGQSGGPVMDLGTGQVCAMTKGSLDESFDLGGYAIPIADALAILPGEDPWEANLACHDDGLIALRRAQVGFGRLPGRVAALIEQQHVAPLLRDQLADLNREMPELATERERCEWIARQLFTLRLGQLVDVLHACASVLGLVALDFLELVACCLPVDDGPTSHWVPSDAAAALRLEWDRERPRVVRLSTDCRETAQLMMVRALYRKAPIGRTLPFSAETGPDGIPPDLVADVFGFLKQRYGVDRACWAKDRAKVVGMLRDNVTVVYLDGRALTDNALLTQLLDLFGGFRFMITSRDRATATDEMLLDLRPPINVGDEGIALGLLRDVEDKLGVKIVAA